MRRGPPGCGPPWHRHRHGGRGPCHHHHGGWFRHRLHRTLFVVFGVIIALTMAITRLTGGDADGGSSHLWSLLVAGILLWLASGALAHLLTRPLRHVAAVARRIGDGELAARVRWGGVHPASSATSATPST